VNEGYGEPPVMLVSLFLSSYGQLE
jgi:hypothetical protein